MIHKVNEYEKKVRPRSDGVVLRDGVVLGVGVVLGDGIVLGDNSVLAMRAMIFGDSGPAMLPQ